MPITVPQNYVHSLNDAIKNNPKNVKSELDSFIKEFPSCPIDVLLQTKEKTQGSERSQSPIEIVTGMGSLEIMNVFKAYGAQFNTADQTGDFPLHLVMELKDSKQRDAFLKFIFDCGTADFNCRNDMGQTIAHLAVKYNAGFQCLMQMYVDYKVDFSLGDKQYQTPRGYAEDRGQYDLALQMKEKDIPLMDPRKQQSLTFLSKEEPKNTDKHSNIIHVPTESGKSSEGAAKMTAFLSNFWSKNPNLTASEIVTMMKEENSKSDFFSSGAYSTFFNNAPPKQELDTSKQELNAPKQELNAPKQELNAPKQELNTPKQNVDNNALEQLKKHFDSDRKQEFSRVLRINALKKDTLIEFSKYLSPISDFDLTGKQAVMKKDFDNCLEKLGNDKQNQMSGGPK